MYMSYIKEFPKIKKFYSLNIFENFADCFIIKYSVISVKLERT